MTLRPRWLPGSLSPFGPPADGRTRTEKTLCRLLQGQAEVKEERNEHIKKFCEAEVSCLLPPKQASAASNWSPATPWRELPNALLLASQYPVDSHGRQDRSKGFLPTNKVHWLTGGLRVFFWCPVRFFGRFMQLAFGQQNFYPPCPHCHTNCDVGADGWIAYPRRFHTASGHSLLYSSQWRCKCGAGGTMMQA